jgi:hypothetical protein
MNDRSCTKCGLVRDSDDCGFEDCPGRVAAPKPWRPNQVKRLWPKAPEGSREATRRNVVLPDGTHTIAIGVEIQHDGQLGVSVIGSTREATVIVASYAVPLPLEDHGRDILRRLAELPIRDLSEEADHG